MLCLWISFRPVSQGDGIGGPSVRPYMPDGAWDMVWQLRDDSPYDIAFDAEGRITVATGNEGKIYRLSGEPLQPMLVARATAQQVTALDLWHIQDVMTCEVC